jgi:hypothetical protein
MHNIFIDPVDIPVHFQSFSVDLYGKYTPNYSEGPRVRVDYINVSEDKVSITLDVNADILSIVNTPIAIELARDANSCEVSGSVSLDIGGDRKVSVHVDISLIDGSNRLYRIESNLLLRNISVHPTRYIFVGTSTDEGFTDGYNASVRMVGDTITIYGGPGEGLGTYSEGSTDYFYIGIKSINGISRGNNINITMSDTVIKNGGSIQ